MAQSTPSASSSNQNSSPSGPPAAAPLLAPINVSQPPPPPPAPRRSRFKAIADDDGRGPTPSPSPLPPSPSIDELLLANRRSMGSWAQAPMLAPPGSPSPNKSKRPRSPIREGSSSPKRPRRVLSPASSPFPQPTPQKSSQGTTHLTPAAKLLKVSKTSPTPSPAPSTPERRSPSHRLVRTRTITPPGAPNSDEVFLTQAPPAAPEQDGDVDYLDGEGLYGELSSQLGGGDNPDLGSFDDDEFFEIAGNKYVDFQTQAPVQSSFEDSL